jgi:hypothetical protein
MCVWGGGLEFFNLFGCFVGGGENGILSLLLLVLVFLLAVQEGEE